MYRHTPLTQSLHDLWTVEPHAASLYATGPKAPVIRLTKCHDEAAVEAGVAVEEEESSTYINDESAVTMTRMPRYALPFPSQPRGTNATTM
jgi:hypothetical protein